MNTRSMTPDQIRRAGLAALARELGPVGMVRFLQQFEIGKGDYTTERHEWLDSVTIDEIMEQLRERHKKSRRAGGSRKD